MKMVIGIIQPYKLDEVIKNLTEAGVPGVTVQEVKGFGRQLGHTELYRGPSYACDFVSKIQITTLVSDSLADKVKEVIASSSLSGKIGDGIVWDIPFDSYTRIRTGEHVNDTDF